MSSPPHLRLGVNVDHVATVRNARGFRCERSHVARTELLHITEADDDQSPAATQCAPAELRARLGADEIDRRGDAGAAGQVHDLLARFLLARIDHRAGPVLQRQLALRGRCVLDGRDIGTVVVPEAQWKF